MGMMIIIWLIILTLWVIVRDRFIWTKIFPKHKTSLMDMAELDFLPSKNKDVWKKKIINDLVPYLKNNSDEYISSEDFRNYEKSVNDFVKNMKTGSIPRLNFRIQSGPMNQQDEMRRREKEMMDRNSRQSNTIPRVSGYSIRI